VMRCRVAIICAGCGPRGLSRGDGMPRSSQASRMHKRVGGRGMRIQRERPWQAARGRPAGGGREGGFAIEAGTREPQRVAVVPWAVGKPLRRRDAPRLKARRRPAVSGPEARRSDMPSHRLSTAGPALEKVFLTETAELSSTGCSPMAGATVVPCRAATPCTCQGAHG